MRTPPYLPKRPRIKLRQLGAGVCQPLRLMRLVAAGSDEALEAFDLIDERPPAYLDGTVTVWIHGVRRY